MLMTPTASKMVWNHCPYWGSFPLYEQQLNWVYVCPWSPETAGPFCPSLELIVVDTPLTQAICSLEVPTWHILCSSEYLGSKVVHLFRRTNPPLKKKKHHSLLYTRYLCVHVWSLDWKGRERETESVVCAKFPLTVTKQFQMKNSQRKTNITKISFICDI